MAAVVAGLARLLQPAMMFPGDEGGCRGLGPWYLLLGLRLVALFIADGPWSSASPDLACNWTLVEVNIQPFCRALCYNQRFSTPVYSSWGFAFLVSSFPVGLMSFIRAGYKTQRKAARPADQELTNSTGGSNNMASGFSMDTVTPRTNIAPSVPKTAHHCTWPSMAFCFCVVLFLATEVCFFWVVTFLQVPSVSKTTFLCLPGAQTCPKALECVLPGQADKKMALWALAFTAFVNIFACLLYLLARLGRVSRCRRNKHGKEDQM